MKALDTVAAIMFLVAGVPTVMFGLFSVVGVLTGLGMTVLGVASGDEELLVGVVVGLAYGIWMLACLCAGPLQLVAGIRLFLLKKDRWTWAGTIASLFPMVTVYCTPFSILAFVFGLLSLLLDASARKDVE